MEFGNEKPEAVFARKAFEISYALVRLAESVPADQFAGFLKAIGLDVLHTVTYEKYDQSLKNLRSAEYFARLAGSIGVISSRNAELVGEEANTLYSAIAVHLDKIKAPHLELDSIFSLNPPSVLYTHLEERIINEEGEKEVLEIDSRITTQLSDKSISESGQNRQSAILEKIRQSGNCRMKDIQGIFPNISERTIRYDLQSLIEQGLIERIGQSGPSTYYRERVAQIV